MRLRPIAPVIYARRTIVRNRAEIRINDLFQPHYGDAYDRYMAYRQTRKSPSRHQLFIIFNFTIILLLYSKRFNK